MSEEPTPEQKAKWDKDHAEGEKLIEKLSGRSIVSPIKLDAKGIELDYAVHTALPERSELEIWKMAMESLLARIQNRDLATIEEGTPFDYVSSISLNLKLSLNDPKVLEKARADLVGKPRKFQDGVIALLDRLDSKAWSQEQREAWRIKNAPKLLKAGAELKETKATRELEAIREEDLLNPEKLRMIESRFANEIHARRIGSRRALDFQDSYRQFARGILRKNEALKLWVELDKSYGRWKELFEGLTMEGSRYYVDVRSKLETDKTGS